jgi:hypothetical protein
MGIALPQEKSEIKRHNPRVFIIYAPPKAGKTTLVSTLPNNLILDLEEGTEYVESLSMKIIGWEAPKKESEEVKKNRFAKQEYYMLEAGKAILEAGRPYDFITVDTATELEEMVKPIALRKYKETPMGSNFDGTDVLSLPRGAGYYYLRLAYKECLEKIKKLANNIILVGHLKDTFVGKEGKEVQAKDLDLTGKIKQITCAGADAIGYLHRGKDNELLINFKSSDEVLCGSRCPQLRGQEIKMADYDEEKNCLINIRWDLIYPDTIKNK